MSIRRFQVYGQRCSGTNALIRLIETNFPALQFTEDYGFKHWLVPAETHVPDDVLIIVIAREIGEWLRSLYRRPWHVRPEMRALSFSQFIRAPWETVWDTEFWNIDEDHPLLGKPISEERCPATGNPFENAIVMRNAKLENWVALANRANASVLVSHQMVVEEPEEIVQQIRRATGVDPQAHFAPVRSYKGEGNRPFAPTNYQPLDPDDLSHVQAHMRADLERVFRR